eukprot:gene15001-6155_t
MICVRNSQRTELANKEEERSSDISTNSPSEESSVFKILENKSAENLKSSPPMALLSKEEKISRQSISQPKGFKILDQRFGFAAVEEFCTIMNLPKPVSKKSYNNISKMLNKQRKKQAVRNMKDAASRLIDLTRENNPEDVEVAESGAVICNAAVVEECGFEHGKNMLSGFRKTDKERIRSAETKVSEKYRLHSRKCRTDKNSKGESNSSSATYQAGAFGLSSTPETGDFFWHGQSILRTDGDSWKSIVPSIRQFPLECLPRKQQRWCDGMELVLFIEALYLQSMDQKRELKDSLSEVIETQTKSFLDKKPLIDRLEKNMANKIKLNDAHILTWINLRTLVKVKSSGMFIPAIGVRGAVNSNEFIDIIKKRGLASLVQKHNGKCLLEADLFWKGRLFMHQKAAESQGPRADHLC